MSTKWRPFSSVVRAECGVTPSAKQVDNLASIFQLKASMRFKGITHDSSSASYEDSYNFKRVAPLHAVCRIEIDDGRSKLAGTGVLIVPGVILTSRQVLDHSSKAARGSALFYEKHLNSICEVELRPEELFDGNTDNGLDYVLVGCGDTGAVKPAVAEVAPNQLAVREGDPVFVVHHAADSPVAVISRTRVAKTHDTHFSYQALETDRCSSGGAVFNASGQLIGLHHHQNGRKSKATSVAVIMADMLRLGHVPMPLAASPMVSPCGLAPYRSIGEAVQELSRTATGSITITVGAGVYVDSVHLAGALDVAIVGVGADPDSIVWTPSSPSLPALWVGGRAVASLTNMTISGQAGRGAAECGPGSATTCWERKEASTGQMQIHGAVVADDRVRGALSLTESVSAGSLVTDSSDSSGADIVELGCSMASSWRTALGSHYGPSHRCCVGPQVDHVRYGDEGGVDAAAAGEGCDGDEVGVVVASHDATLLVAGCHLTDGPGSGIVLAGSATCRLQDSTVCGFKADGIHSTGRSALYALRNRIADGASRGVFIGDAHAVTMHSTAASPSHGSDWTSDRRGGGGSTRGRYGVEEQVQVRATLVDNEVSGHLSHCIEVATFHSVTLSANRIFDSSSNGIVIRVPDQEPVPRRRLDRVVRSEGSGGSDSSGRSDASGWSTPTSRCSGSRTSPPPDHLPNPSDVAGADDGENEAEAAWHHAGEVVVEDNEIRGHRLAGVLVDRALHVVLRGNRISDGAGCGVCVMDGAAVALVANDVHTNALSGVAAAGAAHLTASQNKVFNNGREGISVSAASSAVLTANRVHSNGTAGIQVEGRGSDALISHSRIYDERGVGVEFTREAGGTVRDSTVSSIQGRAGIAIAAAADAVIADCEIRDCVGAGITVSDQGRGTVRNVKVSGIQGTACVAVTDEADVLVEACVMSDAHPIGVLFSSGARGSMLRSRVSGSTVAGVVIESGAAPTLLNNVIVDTPGLGLLVRAGGRGTVLDNEIKGTQRAGMEVAGDGSSVTLCRNRIHDCRDAGLYIHSKGVALVTENDISRNRYAGITIGALGEPTIVNNRFTDGLSVAICACSDARGTIGTNRLLNNNGGGDQLELQHGSGVNVWS